MCAHVSALLFPSYLYVGAWLGSLPLDTPRRLALSEVNNLDAAVTRSPDRVHDDVIPFA